MSGSPPRLALIFEGQALHALLLAPLLLMVAALAQLAPVRAGGVLGLATPVWLWLVVAGAVTHQLYVWLCWRLELHGGALSRHFGRAAFPLYGAGFFLLGGLRFVVVGLLAFGNRGTLPQLPGQALAVIDALPVLWLLHSMHRYFPLRRAIGCDHFDPACRAAPLVRAGIFRYTPNAMYVVGFLSLWLPGLWFGSAAGLAGALFSHAYIWVHYFATERPDMRRLYGGPPAP